MRFDQQSIRDQQRKAVEALTREFFLRKVVHPGEISLGKEKNGFFKIKNKNYVPPKLTSSPAKLIQELPWSNSTQTYTFDFSQNGPQQTPGLNNNSVIFKNDIICIYAISMLFGTLQPPISNVVPYSGAADMIYRAHGVLPADNALYNSTISMVTESSTYINKMDGLMFLDVPTNSNEFYGEIGMQIINPVRIITGELGKFQFKVDIKNPISSLVLSANTVVSFQLHGVYGQAQG